MERGRFDAVVREPDAVLAVRGFARVAAKRPGGVLAAELVVSACLGVGFVAVAVWSGAGLVAAEDSKTVVAVDDFPVCGLRSVALAWLAALKSVQLGSELVAPASDSWHRLVPGACVPGAFLRPERPKRRQKAMRRLSGT